MTREELIEALADAEHISWSHWMGYLFDCCVFLNDKHLGAADPDDMVIPGEKVRRWRRQIATRYAKLTEPEKQMDRHEVGKILPAIDAYAGLPVVHNGMHQALPVAPSVIVISDALAEALDTLLEACSEVVDGITPDMDLGPALRAVRKLHDSNAFKLGGDPAPQRAVPDGVEPRAERALKSSAEAYRLVEEAREMREQRDAVVKAGEQLWVELQDAAFGWDMVPDRVKRDAKEALACWRETVGELSR